MGTYTIKPVRGYWFTQYLLKILRGRSGCFNTTLDLGFTLTRVCVENGKLLLRDNVIGLESLKLTSDDRVLLYSFSEGVYEVVRSTSTGYYKLKAIALDKAPTLEINGIHMHRITEIDPWSDAKLKVARLGVKPGERVLDTCLGLGYTAIHSLLRGASQVISFEIDPNVLWIAERNPWSHRLVDNRIVIYNDDVTRGIADLPSNHFDKVLHDPPRYSKSTGELYSLEFYRELYRVLKPGGKLYHYTGEPRKHGTPSIVKGIGERLRKAGFYPVFFDHRSLGYIAIKPKT